MTTPHRTPRPRLSSLKNGLLLSLALAAAGISCERIEGDAIDEEDAGALGRIRVELTDAALDDPNVDDVFVTISGIALDGPPLDRLSERRTVHISKYTDGRSVQYGADQMLRAGVYDGVEVIFDLDRDAAGSGPGAYVTDVEGAKTSLAYGARTAKILVPDHFEVRPDALTELILDIDLRRAIQRKADGSYSFGSDAALAESLRLVDKRLSGSIEGTITNHAGTTNPGETRVVYAFEHGDFFQEAAAEDDFSSAVTSTRVFDSGRFRLSYLPPGRYELIAVDFADTDGDGVTELMGARISDAIIAETLREVTVSAGALARIELRLGQRL